MPACFIFLVGICLFAFAVKGGSVVFSCRMKAIRRGRPQWLGTLLALCLAALRGGIACPRLCACYVPTEVHCTFRYFTAIPPHIPPNVERINLGYV